MNRDAPAYPSTRSTTESRLIYASNNIYLLSWPSGSPVILVFRSESLHYGCAVNIHALVDSVEFLSLILLSIVPFGFIVPAWFLFHSYAIKCHLLYTSDTRLMLVLNS